MNKFKKNLKRQEVIGIRAIESGLGATHISICMANFIGHKIGGKVALIEWNPKNDFAEIEKSYYGFGLSKTSEESFKIRKVEYFKQYSRRGLSYIKEGGFNWIIVDYGASKKQLFYEADHPILIIQANEWKGRRALDLIEKSKEEIGSRCKILINLGNKEERKFIEKHYKGEVYCFPFNKDPYVLESKTSKAICQILEI